MLSSTLAAAALVGLLGSLHCTFMCGPLLVAGCSTESGLRARRAPAYFAARVVSYAFVGALFGQLGAHAAHRLSGPTVQRVLLGLVAAAMLWKGIRLIRAARPRPELVLLGRAPSPSEKPSPLWARLAALVPRRAAPLGLVTGLLPCGLLASGWALAASTGRPLDGALVMAAFSLATAPGLVAALVVGLRLGGLRRRWSPAWQGALWCALALWIGVRPLFVHAHCGGH